MTAPALPEDDPAPARWRRRLAACLAVLVLSVAPYARAHLWPPAGRTFLGTFYFVPDVYHYFSYAQQAEEGAFVFRNKLTPGTTQRGMVNLEWWAAGRLSALLGGRLFLAWRVLGVAAAVAMVLLIDAWLGRIGIPRLHRGAALFLVLCGGGLGGWLWPRSLLDRPHGILLMDVRVGLFPFLELLTNPHFVTGTALLLGALLAMSRGGAGGWALGLLTASVAGLSRPYDLAMITGVHGLAVLMSEPPRRWARRLLPLAGLLPVVAYNWWLFYAHPAFRTLTLARATPRLPLLLALAPAGALLAVSALRTPPAAAAARLARTYLWAWVVGGIPFIVFQSLPYSLQFLAGYGLPLLALGALGLARFRPWVTVASALSLSGSAVAAYRIVLQDDPLWFAPSAHMDAARALRPACRPGEVVMAPEGVGLLALALSPCSAHLSHPVMPDFARREGETRSFYAEWTPGERAAFLDRACIDVLVLPGDDGPTPAAWLGPAAPFRRLSAGGGYAIYARGGPERNVTARSPGCARPQEPDPE